MTNIQNDSSFLERMSRVVPGTLVCGKYQIINRIGDEIGVFEVKTDAAEKSVLQFLNAGVEPAQFEQDMKAAKQINHPNVVRILDSGIDPILGPFVHSEYISAQSLSQKIKEKGALNELEFLDIASQVGKGLAQIHKKGFSHNNLACSNIFVSADYVVKVAGFGLQKSLSENGIRSDIFAFGSLMYEALCGRRPFAEENLAAAESSPATPARFGDLAPAKVVNQQIETVVFRCLAKNPQERYQSASDVLSDLKRIEEGEEVRPIPKASATKTPVVMIVAGIALLAVAGIGAYFVMQSSGSNHSSVSLDKVQAQKDKEKQELIEQATEAEALANAGNFSAAAELYNRIEPRFQREFGSNSPQRIDILHKLGKNQLLSGEIGPAKDAYVVIAIMHDKYPSLPRPKVPFDEELFHLTKEHLFDKGQFDAASEGFRAVHKIQTTTRSSFDYHPGKTLAFMARSEDAGGDGDRANKYFKWAMETTEKPSDPKAEEARAFVLVEYADFLMTRNESDQSQNYAKSVRLLLQAMPLLEKSGDKKRLDEVRKKIQRCYKVLGDSKQASKYK